MSDYIIDDARNRRFDQVWSRVAQAAPQVGLPRPDAAMPLREFIDEKHRFASLFKELAQRCSGGSRQALAGISAGEREYMVRLQTELFLLSGELHSPAELCSCIDGTLTALGTAYREKAQIKQRYAVEAASCGDPRLEALYGEIAGFTSRQMEILSRLVEKAMS